jgi:hypothetical protein
MEVYLAADIDAPTAIVLADEEKEPNGQAHPPKPSGVGCLTIFFLTLASLFYIYWLGCRS